jgi:hypothetical protein
MKLAQRAAGNPNPESFAGELLLSSETEGKRARVRWNKHRLIAIDELNPGIMLKAEEMIKRLTAHSGAEMREMYKSEDTDNKFLSKIIFMSNDAPRFVDNSGALQARMRIIQCPVSKLGAEDFKLTAKLAAEAGAFASVCTGLAAALLRCGLPLPESTEMKQIKADWGQQNPLKAFVQDECILGINERCSQTEFRTAYTEYCEAHGYKAKGDSSLYRSLIDCGFKINNQGYVHNGRAYDGLRLRTISDAPANTANTAPTLFDQYVGGFLGDWKAIKRASANTANTISSHSPLESYTSLFVDVQATQTTKQTQPDIVEDVSPLKVSAVSADDVLSHSNEQKSADIPADTRSGIVGSVGANGHEAAAQAYQSHGVAVGPQAERMRINLSTPIPQAKIDKELADIELQGGYDE